MKLDENMKVEVWIILSMTRTYIVIIVYMREYNVVNDFLYSK